MEGTSLAVQWLGLQVSTVGNVYLIPGWGTRIPCHVAWLKKKDHKLQSKCPLAREQGFVLLAMIIPKIISSNLYITIYKIGNQWEIAVCELLELTQTYVYQVGDAIQPSHSLSSPSPPIFNLSQHQGLFKWVSSLHQVAKVFELQLQHQSFQ